MKKDFIVRRSITMIEGKPHVETYSEQELVRCKGCKHWQRNTEVRNFGFCYLSSKVRSEEWFCADGDRTET